MSGSYPEELNDMGSVLEQGRREAGHMSGPGMFTEVATSKLLGCLTLITKPLRAPKPLAWP